ncbi:MAG: hypothetical protein HYX77_04215 [Acidobacteria bacterium]|nr:hypothetical protein [Acidobacteriota bacterium]
MKILFAMASPEYLRFYDATIQLLAARGHRVALAVNARRDKKPVRLDGLDDGEGRIVTVGLVPERRGVWGSIAYGLRGLMDFSRYLHPRFTAAPALRARMKRKVLPRAFHALDGVRTLGVTGTRLLLAALAALERGIPGSRAVEAFVRAQDPDVLLVSPLVDAGSDQVDLVKAARALGVPVAVGIASWDNLTNKGLLRVQPDQVIVWNEAQRREAIEYHATPRDRVVVTGAQPFDRWFERRPSSTREEFCARVGLPLARPYVLYTCSSSFIAISPAEVSFVRSWIIALRAHPATASLPVLVRPHPYNRTAWETADFSSLQSVVVWPNHPYNPVEEESRNGFFDSLYHSAAVVGINTSAMIEAAILGRSVLSMHTQEFAGTQDGTLHFQYLLPENGGFLRVASTLDEHIVQLADVLSRQDEARAETARFVSSFIRPHGLGVPCTPLVADAIEALGRDAARRVQKTPWWAPLLWPVLFAGGGVAGAWWAATDPKAVRSLRRKAGARLHRARKVLARGVRIGVDRLSRRGTRAARRWNRMFGAAAGRR